MKNEKAMKTWSVRIEAAASDLDVLVAELWSLGTLGLEETDAGVLAYFSGAEPPELGAVRTDLEGGVAEEILGPMEKIEAAGGYALKIGEQKFVVDEEMGSDLPGEGDVRLLYAPQSRVVLSVESL